MFRRSCSIHVVRAAALMLCALGSSHALAQANLPAANQSPATGKYAPPNTPASKAESVIVKTVDPKTGHVTYSDRVLEGTTGAVQYQVRSFGASSQPLTQVPNPNPSGKADAKAEGNLVEWAKGAQRKMDENSAAQKELVEKMNREACSRARQNLATLNSGARIVHPDAKGDAAYLTDEQIAVERTNTERTITTACAAGGA